MDGVIRGGAMGGSDSRRRGAERREGRGRRLRPRPANRRPGDAGTHARRRHGLHSHVRGARGQSAVRGNLHHHHGCPRAFRDHQQDFCSAGNRCSHRRRRGAHARHARRSAVCPTLPLLRYVLAEERGVESRTRAGDRGAMTVGAERATPSNS